ncbi:MAG: hypothetical protein JWR15_3817 [Prosthecobacter sp.]|nr:hypothetical protein [Prosthecobacter sp.]
MKKAFLLLAVFCSLTLHAADFPAGSPKFFTTTSAALKAAKENGKPIIMVFSAHWCAPCQSMVKDVYPSSLVQPLQDKFNWAYLDIDDEANNKLADGFKVETVPYIFFLDAEAKTTLDQLDDATTSEKFAKKLTEVLKKYEAAKKGGA